MRFRILKELGMKYVRTEKMIATIDEISPEELKKKNEKEKDIHDKD